MQNGVRFVFISRAQHTKRLHPAAHPPHHHHLSPGAETDEMQRALKDNRPDARERKTKTTPSTPRRSSLPKKHCTPIKSNIYYDRASLSPTLCWHRRMPN
ncbi:hypothetical protein TNCT_197961 [Trichonephila clavata]|uniref:Uncharacterized protein n=1 Tax=Trichonephila clavata TaxID=2740835 RepID=A0A8X6HSD8_TRICU|nr:hypothetical protein TNCT_197961 [Trichonephila clavata]